MSLDEQIIIAQAHANERMTAGDMRGWRAAVDKLRALKHRRIRRDKRKGLFKTAAEQTAVLAMFGAGAVLFCLASPIDAYAATEAMSADNAQVFNLLAAWALLALFVGWLWSILRRATEPEREDDDPYKADRRETNEDRFRRAYAESDGDHKSYVDYKRFGQ